MKDLNFYIPEPQTVPTDLRLRGEGIDIYYKRLPDEFGYEFKVYHPGAPDPPAVVPDRELIEAVARKMCSQSYDHGASWRIRRVCLVHTAESWWDCNIFRVLFRVRDAG